LTRGFLAGALTRKNHSSEGWLVGRRRTEGVQLPEGVQIVRKPGGRTYYYFVPHRNTKEAGPRVALPSNPQDPVFWSALRKAKGGGSGTGTFEKLILEYRASPEWGRLRPATQRDYAAYLDRLLAEAGDRLVADVTRKKVYQMRDAMASTPVAANHMLAVLRTIIEWGIPRDYSENNPVVGVDRLVIEEKGAAPWPEEGYQFVLAHAPPDLFRMAFLGRSTGQRAGDLVRMRPTHLEVDGINVSVGKRRETKHFVPLTAPEIAEIKSWRVGDLFIKSPRNQPYSADHLGSRWQRWRDSEQAAPIRHLHMTIHGLRATKIADLRMSGIPDGAIATEVGLTPAMVTRYSRFADKARLARKSRDERERKTIGFENSQDGLKTG
jgi:integrase